MDADPDLDTPAGERLNASILLVQAYEALCVPVDAELVEHLRSLTSGVEVDLDQPLPPEIDDPGMP
ncbi:hypothetical protein [Acidovorax soli]|uniref:hypothetical protein n=1 Tax=Acidovorax soli TaxID=592050 RepID=UPI00111496E8|nr:hypothetical protein [Acidovorax soli]